MYRVAYATGAVTELKAIPAYYRRGVADAIRQQLTREPAIGTRNRKDLPGLVPPWEHTPPVWELRVGDYRVFYDVDEQAALVCIRAVRLKPPGVTTEDTL